MTEANVSEANVSEANVTEANVKELTGLCDKRTESRWIR